MPLKNQRASARQSAGVCAFSPFTVFADESTTAPIPNKKMAL
jgi:hypothetical protein